MSAFFVIIENNIISTLLLIRIFRYHINIFDK